MELQQPASNEFPNGPCMPDKVYVMDNAGQRIIIMSEEDWAKFGTRFEQLRVMAAAQDKRMRELHADIAARDKQHADVLDKLEALRTVRRAERRVDIMDQIMSLPDVPTDVSVFTIPTTKES